MAVATVPLSQHGNAWLSTAVAAGGKSQIVDIAQTTTFLSIFGNVGGATTIQVLYSADGVNFYNTGSAHQFVAAGVTDFVIEILGASARYVQLLSTGAVTITATIAGKP